MNIDMLKCAIFSKMILIIILVRFTFTKLNKLRLSNSWYKIIILYIPILKHNQKICLGIHICFSKYKKKNDNW